MKLILRSIFIYVLLKHLPLEGVKTRISQNEWYRYGVYNYTMLLCCIVRKWCESVVLFLKMQRKCLCSEGVGVCPEKRDVITFIATK